MGCKYLANARWPKLKKLSLGRNGIGNYGCGELIKASWVSLEVIYLSINLIIKLIATLEMKGADYCPRTDGKN